MHEKEKRKGKKKEKRVEGIGSNLVHWCNSANMATVDTH